MTHSKITIQNLENLKYIYIVLYLFICLHLSIYTNHIHYTQPYRNYKIESI